eukprot:GILK01003092.1.p1 GENE.GILK01003092.1~~GILK01003092.1.p1  ORF type:complete len:377 (+),score=42.88 GILK01003092.1:75-1133(+)
MAETAKLLSYNLYIQPPGVRSTSYTYKNQRIELFVEEFLPDFDVVCLQEVWKTILPSALDYRQDWLMQLATTKGFTHAVKSQRSSLWSLKLVDGGLITLSKHPIVAHEWYPFQDDGMALERVCANGVLYTLINIHGTPIHIFNTHFQSDHVSRDRVEGLGSTSRQKQTSELLHMIKRLTSCDDYPIFVVGDLNIEAWNRHMDPPQSTAEYHSLLATLKAKDLAFESLGTHPITIGDTYFNEDTGEEIPCDVVLTGAVDLGIKQCLDYFLSIPRETAQCTSAATVADKCVADAAAGVAETKTEKDVGTVTVVNTAVEKFAVSGHPFGYLSDHYGLSATLRLPSKVIPTTEVPQ